MATSLLRIGRLGSLKALQLESWGVLGRPAASLCTQGGEPPAKQAKAPSKTVVAPDERASLLAYKTAVAFPVRLAPTGFSPAPPLGEPQPESIPVAQTAVAATAAATLGPPATPAVEAPLAKEPLLEEASVETPALVVEATHPVDTEVATEVAAEAPPSPAEPVVAETPVVAKTTDDGTPVATTSSAPEGLPADGSSSSSSSSSSSDSDSDSDSDSEEEDVKTKESSATAPSAGEVGVGQDSVTPEADVKDQTGDAEQEMPALETIPVETPPTSETETAEVAEVPVAPTAAGLTGETSEELVDSAPQISAVAEEPVADAAPQVEEPAAELPSDSQPTPDAPLEASPPPTPSDEPAVVLQPAAEAQVEPESLEAAEAPPIEKVDEAPVGASEAAPVADAVEITPAEEDQTPAVEAEVPVAEEGAEPVSEVAPDSVAPEAEVKAAAPVEGAEELVDPAPVLTGAAGEDLQAEVPAEPDAVDASEERAAAPEPEEPFDNSTYKNYEHHNYNAFTFADLDLEMAKHRLPQPSSGRPSPQH